MDIGLYASSSSLQSRTVLFIIRIQVKTEKDKGINIKDTGFDYVLLSSHESKTCAYGL